jgi:hypothetical protein
LYLWSTRWRSWLRHCATSGKVAGSIPDGVIRIFHWIKPSGCTMALGSNWNEYQVHFLGEQATGAKTLYRDFFALYLTRVPVANCTSFVTCSLTY